MARARMQITVWERNITDVMQAAVKELVDLTGMSNDAAAAIINGDGTSIEAEWGTETSTPGGSVHGSGWRAEVDCWYTWPPEG